MALKTGHLTFDVTAGRQWKNPVTRIGGLPIAAIGRASSAQLMIDIALNRRNSGLPPVIFTSANGQVLSLCARQSRIRDLFLETDLIHADDMPLVLASRLAHKAPLPERVCTTVLFHDVAKIAPRHGARMLFLGETKEVIDASSLEPREQQVVQ